VSDNATFDLNETINYIIPRQIKMTCNTKPILLNLDALKLMERAAGAASTSMIYALITNAVLQLFM